jgi:bifunctional non-homologous end joining protein LigD
VRRRSRAQHALVGGWSQSRGDFVSLLLGVREGRRRKLTYVGEVTTDSDRLAMRLLEPRLREGEIEASPFAEAPSAHADRTHHWVTPDVVAEIEFDDWSRERTVKNASLRGVAERSSFRHANWVTPPESP